MNNQSTRLAAALLLSTFPLAAQTFQPATPSTEYIRAGAKTVAVRNYLFTDVPTNSPYFDSAHVMYNYGITVGCSATTYCPNDTLTRGQMAVFLIRSLSSVLYGLGNQELLTPNPSPISPFADVCRDYQTPPYCLPSYSNPNVTPYLPAPHPYLRYIARMWELGITTGCYYDAGTGERRYCPEPASALPPRVPNDANATRSQMAVFSVRAYQFKANGCTAPPPGTVASCNVDAFSSSPSQVFADVPPTHAHFPWVQRGVALGIIVPGNCVQGPSGNCYFGPDTPITRGDTSLFIVRGFLKGGS